MRRVVPFLIALGGAVAITVAIGLVTARFPIPGLSSLYLLLVLWLGARYGIRPAIVGSFAAFLLYDYFFVPPVGTLTVSGPRELLELILLLAVALVTGQLAASLRIAKASSETLALESRALYDLATAALRLSEVTTALSLVCERAMQLASVERFALVAIDKGHASALAGGLLDADDVLVKAAWAYEHSTPVGISISNGNVKTTRSRPAGTGPALLPLRNGVVAIWFAHRDEEPEELRMLGALIGLADLLLDRRRAALESERAAGLEASDKLKAAILSSLSHELKSPIASLRAGLTALVAPRAGLQPDQQELLLDLDRQANRLDHMVGDMLALSRLEAGVDLHREAHSFADLVGSALHQLRAELRGHDVKVDIGEDLPPVDVDELQVGRVLTNLLENALEWMKPGGTIRIGAAARERVLEAWVENDGPSIPPTDLDRVFETFWTRRERGSGLGLAICKRVVEAHGGRIQAENRRAGPRFVFTLPMTSAVVAPK